MILRKISVAFIALVMPLAGCSTDVEEMSLNAGPGRAIADGDKTASTAQGHNSDVVEDDAIYLNSMYSPEERAADLVSRMTLEEKALQLNSSQAPAIPHLGLNAYGWWNEAAHGVAREQYNHDANPFILINTTSYPVDLSLGATWDPELMYEEATLISDEARDVYRENMLDLNFYSPTINLSRDPRWGRNDETFSEDPYLTAAIAAQFVNGMEGKNMQGQPLPEGGGYLKLSTTLKHYAANNSEFDRLVGNSAIDERTLREYYTAAFREVISSAGPSSIMTAYNAVNGIPSSINVFLLDTLARQTFGFNGFFTSDCDAISTMDGRMQYMLPGAIEPINELERHAYALTAGVDLNCNKGYHDEFSYGSSLPGAISAGISTFTGIVNENDVDVAAVRLMTTRMKMGEFDDATQVPWVMQARDRLPEGTWVNGDENGAITQTADRLAMARRVAAESIVMLKNDPVGDGCHSKSLLPLQVPEQGEYKVAVVGYFADLSPVFLGGYPSIQESAGIANEVTGYEGIAAAIKAKNPDATVTYLPGMTSGDLDEIDSVSVEAIADYDVVVVYVGDDERHSREDVDRQTIALPGVQSELIRAVASQNPNTVVYMETVGTVDVTEFEPSVSALLWSSQNGQRKGEGLADVLLGTVNPSGHLPFTWYRDDAQLPPITDYSLFADDDSPGRTYMYFEGEASYPFGHGLSYSDFRISHMRLQRGHVNANGQIVATASVANIGDVAGAEVVQLYVSTPHAPACLNRPKKRLRGFKKVFLNPGESKRLQFVVDVPSLAFFDEQLGRRVVDSGV
jgi:beta-glucosidase